MPVRPLRLGLVAAVLAGATLTACSHDGRTLRPPGPDQTLSIVTTTTSIAPVTLDTDDPGSGTLLALDLPWGDGGAIDAKYTCKGADVSPAMTWENIPDGTEEVAISVIDLDSDPPGFVHWVVTGIDPSIPGLDEGVVPEGAIQAGNSFSTTGWKGPCPPSGEHTYLFTLYALDGDPGIVDGQDGKGAISSIEQRQIASVAVAGLFGTP
jgi:Raf kinase inhibitor-like YbhB/YbcL family protein